MRKAIFWTHLVSGLFAGLLILFFSITGSLLAYERPILRAADARYNDVAAGQEDASRIPLAAVLDAVAATAPAPVDSLTLRAGNKQMVEVQTTDHRVYLANPYTGALHGPVSPRLRAFFSEVTALHRWFGLADAHHATAIIVKGSATLLVFVLISTGAYLWMPRAWTRKSVKSAIVPHLRAQGRAWNYHAHRVTGFWIGVPFGVIGLTGILMAFPWANAIMFRVAGSPLPQRTALRRDTHERRSGRNHDPVGLDAAFIAAEANVQAWKTATLRLAPGAKVLNFTMDRGEGGHPDQRVQVTIDAASLQVTHTDAFASLSRGQRWRVWTRFVHTGEAGGWWGETIAFATALGASLLVVTGVLLWLGRFRRWRVAHRAVT